MARRSNRQYRKASRSRLEQVGSSTIIGRKSPEFEPDYSYVIRDLRRIALNAGICLAILLILTFIF
jgi:hypothetical protein